MKRGDSKGRWGFWVGVVALVAFVMTGPVMAEDLTVDNYETYPVTESISFYNEFIGVTNSGTLNQQAATNNVNNLYLGYGTASFGTYYLDGGSLLASNEYIGYGSNSYGSLTQSGGTNTVTNTFTIGANNTSYGQYYLKGGTLSAGTITVNAVGSFVQEEGILSGTLVNWGNFVYKGGTFNGRLVL